MSDEDTNEVSSGEVTQSNDPLPVDGEAPISSEDDHEEVEYLDDWVRDTVFFITRYHGVSGNIPSDADILEYLKLTKKYEDVKEEDLNNLKTNEPFLKSMAVRGLNVNTAFGELRAVTDLKPRQIEAVAAMLNPIDRRSDEKKLRDIGVSTEEWGTWMQDNRFVKYVHGRAEQLLSNSTHEAHMGLIRGVRQGNTASIKLHYEITGRYNPNEENQVNVRMLIGRVLEAIQQEVQDSETLNRLAIKLSQIAIESSNPASPVDRSQAPISSTRKEIENNPVAGEIEAIQEIVTFDV